MQPEVHFEVRVGNRTDDHLTAGGSNTIEYWLRADVYLRKDDPNWLTFN
jgi:hypothetical protein